MILLRVSEIRANTLFFGRGPEIEGMARLAPTIEPTESKAGSGSTAATEVTRFGTLLGMELVLYSISADTVTEGNMLYLYSIPSYQNDTSQYVKAELACQSTRQISIPLLAHLIGGLTTSFHSL